MIASERVEEEGIAHQDTSPAGTSDPHSVINIESCNSPSSPSSSSLSSLDDRPLNQIYTNLKGKPSEEPVLEPFNYNERIGAISQLRIDVAKRCPPDHPIQPPVIQPLNFIFPETELHEPEPQSEPTNNSISSSEQEIGRVSPHFQETNVLENLEHHYSGELPEVISEQEKASEMTSLEVTSDSPQQQLPLPEIATNPEVVVSTELPEHGSSEQPAYDQATTY